MPEPLGAVLRAVASSTTSTATPSPSPRTSAARSDWRAFDGDRTGAVAANPDFAKGQGASLVCVSDDQANAAVDFDMCGSLKAGGSAVNSNGTDFVGALCARDSKGVGNEWIGEGKLICQEISREDAQG